MSYSTRGTDTMKAMLLSQYVCSPNVQEYLLAYVTEMDLLFKSINDVYWGRFLETAVGAQLDIIGDILQQSRSINIPTEYFGFLGAVGANSFNEGVFKSSTETGYTVTPLNDTVYRKVLKARALIMTEKVFSEDVIYNAITEIIGTRYPTMKITNLGYEVSLTLPAAVDVSTVVLIIAISSWLIPMAYKLTITTV